MRLLCPFLLVLILASGCRSGRPDYTINAPPNLANIRPQRSVMFTELLLPMAILQNTLEMTLSAEGEGTAQLDTTSGPVSARYKLSRLGVELLAVNGDLVVRLPLRAEITLANEATPCSAIETLGALLIRFHPRLEPTGELLLKDPSARVEPAPFGELVCGAKRVPQKSIESAILAPLVKYTEGSIKDMGLPLGPLLSRAIVALAEPRTLGGTDGKPAVCLDLLPTALILAPIKGDSDTLRLKLGLEVAPRLSVGACQSSPMPPLSAEAREENLDSKKGYALQVAVAVPMALLNEQLKAAKGKKLGEGARQLTVQAAQLGDANGRLLLRLDVTGAFNGAIYLWGTPTGVKEGQKYVIKVPDLQMAFESRSLLEKLKILFIKSHQAAIVEKLRGALVWDVTSRMESVQKALSVRYEVSMNGVKQSDPAAAKDKDALLVYSSMMDAVVPLQIDTRPGTLVMHILLTGRSSIDAR